MAVSCLPSVVAERLKVVWDPELKPLRKAVFTILGGAVMITILVMWACIPFFYGSCMSLLYVIQQNGADKSVEG